MLKRLIFPLILGLAGLAVLVSLGLWQVERLRWKEGVLAGIEAAIAAPPVALPAAPDPARDAYLPIAVSGQLTGEGARVLASVKGLGAGHRLIGVLEARGRRLLVDLGFVPLEGDLTQPAGPVALKGNLHWPDEQNRHTPAPDLVKGLWFARDIDGLSTVLKTEPVLIVTRDPVVPQAIPIPVDTAHIPNDHLGYAVTWFGLALVWAGMTILYLWRITRRTS